MTEKARIKGLISSYDPSAIKSFLNWYKLIRDVGKSYRLNFITTSTLLFILTNHTQHGKSTTVNNLQKNIEGYESPASTVAIRLRLAILLEKGLIDEMYKDHKTKIYLPSKLLLNALFKN